MIRILPDSKGCGIKPGALHRPRPTRQAWRSTGAPIEQELTAQLAATEDAKTQLGTQRLERATWLLQHPDTLDRLAALDRETRRLELEAGIARPDQPALPIPPPTPRGPGLAM